jgi:hypothetical protein
MLFGDTQYSPYTLIGRVKKQKTDFCGKEAHMKTG